MISDFSDYIGLPYDQYNCWQLAKKIFADIKRIDLPDKVSEAGSSFVEIWYEDGLDAPYPRLKAFDGLVMRRHRPYAEHIAVMIDDKRFLHTRRRVGSCIEPIDRWHSKIIQIVRHHDLQ